jgi:hypothetical protein
MLGLEREAVLKLSKKIWSSKPTAAPVRSNYIARLGLYSPKSYTHVSYHILRFGDYEVRQFTQAIRARVA